MSSLIRMVSVFALSGAACFAAMGCVTSANGGDEDVSDAPQAQQEYGSLGGIPGGDQGAGQFSKFSKKAPPPIQSAPVEVQPFSKKAPPPVEVQPFSKKAPPPIQAPPFAETAPLQTQNL